MSKQRIEIGVRGCAIVECGCAPYGAYMMLWRGKIFGNNYHIVTYKIL
jgi:hypothetical protein